MKKITYYFSMIFMAVMMLSLTSCDEDADIASLVSTKND